MKDLKRFAEIQAEINELENQIADLKDVRTIQWLALFDETEAMGQGEIAGYGYRAYWKPGRKSTDHETAAAKWGVSDEIIDEFTTTPEPRVAWAKVTKAAKVDKETLAKHTTQAKSQFVIVATPDPHMVIKC